MAICAALSHVVERRTRIGTYLSAPMLATFFALGAAAAGIIPTVSTVYDLIWTYLLPLAAALYLLECDISQLFTTAGQSIVAFFNGALGTVVGTLVAYALIGRFLGPDGSTLAAALCASYIGGSVNFAAVASLLGLASGSTLAAAMTADNLAMAAYISVLMAIPATLPPSLTQADIINANNMSATGANKVTDSNSDGSGDVKKENSSSGVTSESLGLALAAGTLACCMGNILSTAAGFSSGGLAFTALASSGIAALAGWARRAMLKREGSESNAQQIETHNKSVFEGAEALGGSLMMLFFATIGAAAGSLKALAGSGWLLAFIFVQLSVQIGIALSLGKAMRIPMPVILIAANANVGGPATAAAMAGAKGWHALVQPAILTGALGYAIANGIGWGMGMWLKSWYVFV